MADQMTNKLEIKHVRKALTDAATTTNRENIASINSVSDFGENVNVLPSSLTSNEVCYNCHSNDFVTYIQSLRHPGNQKLINASDSNFRPNPTSSAVGTDAYDTAYLKGISNELTVYTPSGKYKQGTMQSYTNYEISNTSSFTNKSYDTSITHNCNTCYVRAREGYYNGAQTFTINGPTANNASSLAYTTQKPASPATSNKTITHNSGTAYITIGAGYYSGSSYATLNGPTARTADGISLIVNNNQLYKSNLAGYYSASTVDNSHKASFPSNTVTVSASSMTTDAKAFNATGALITGDIPKYTFEGGSNHSSTDLCFNDYDFSFLHIDKKASFAISRSGDSGNGTDMGLMTFCLNSTKCYLYFFTNTLLDSQISIPTTYTPIAIDSSYPRAYLFAENTPVTLSLTFGNQSYPSISFGTRTAIVTYFDNCYAYAYIHEFNTNTTTRKSSYYPSGVGFSVSLSANASGGINYANICCSQMVGLN